MYENEKYWNYCNNEKRKRIKAIRASMKNHSTVFWIPIVKSIGRSKLNYIK